MKPSEWIHNRAREIAASIDMKGRTRPSPVTFYGLATKDFDVYGVEEIACKECKYVSCKCK